MSRDDDRCAHQGCNLQHDRHVLTDHVFFEPARAEAPQGETLLRDAKETWAERAPKEAAFMESLATVQPTTCTNDHCESDAKAAQPKTDGDGCRCVIHEGDVRCVGPVCSTVERWAAACRASHWFQDDELRPWGRFIDDSPDEADLWRHIARAAIARLENDYE